MGHFVAAKTTHQLSAMDEIFRNCAINPNVEIPNNIHFYVIFNPYKEIRIIRDFIIMAGANIKSATVCNIIKIDPIAIIITNSPFFGSGFLNWNCYCDLYWKKEIRIIFKMTDILPLGMPENDFRLVRMFGKYAYESISATIEKRTA